MLTGESDAADVPSQILVFFPLAASVTEEVLATGARKLEKIEKQPTPTDAPGVPPKLKSTAPTGDTSGYGARPGSLHRVFLMRGQDTDESYKYGFAEFWTLEDALAAVTKFKMAREFTIASTPVSVSTIHLGVFVPETRETSESTEHLSFHPLFNPALRVKYWDPHVYPSEKVVTQEPPSGTVLPTANEEANADSKKSKKRKADGSLPSASAKKPLVMSGQLAVWQKKHAEIHDDATGGRGQQGTGSDAGGMDTSDGQERAPVKISLSGANAIGTSDARTPIRISLNSTLKPTGEPTGPTPQDASNRRPSPDLAPSLPGNESRGGAGSDPTAATNSPVSYVDREKVCCLLCMMKYKSLDDLNTHERSRNHKNAMADEEKCQAAKPRLAARDKRMQKKSEEGSMDSEDTAPQYRDRAKERRDVYKQPSKPAGQGNKPPKSDNKHPRQGAEAETPTKTASKGSAMLAKMGWNTGQGLGANGDGRTNIIATTAYQEGVGLGAEGGNLGDAAELAERKTKNSYTDYVNTVQDKARERYNRLN